MAGPKQYNPSQYIQPQHYPSGFNEVIYVDQEITSLNHRFKIRCPECNMRYYHDDVVAQFITNEPFRQLQQVSMGLNCGRCNKQYRILLTLKLPRTVDYIKLTCYIDDATIV